MVITGEEFSMTGKAIASPVNMLKYALCERDQRRKILLNSFSDTAPLHCDCVGKHWARSWLKSFALAIER